MTKRNQMVKFAYFYHLKNKLTNQTCYLTSTPIEVGVHHGLHVCKAIFTN